MVDPSSTAQNFLFLCIGTVLNGLMVMYIFRWKKRENVPEELHKAIENLALEAAERETRQNAAMLTIRTRLAYIEGRLNGKMWKGN